MTATSAKVVNKKMAQNKKEVTFEDTSPAAKYKENEAVLKVLNRMEECLLCARGPQTTSTDQTPVQKDEELVESVKRTLQAMSNVVNDTSFTPSMMDSQLQMYNLLKIGLNQDLERMFAIILLAAEHVSS